MTRVVIGPVTWSGLFQAGVLLSVAAIVAGRFFTETVPILPRVVNVADFVALPCLAVVAVPMIRARLRDGAPIYGRSIALLSGLFVVVCALSSLANPDVNWIGALLFIAGLLMPIGFFLLIINCGGGAPFARQVTRLLYGLFLANVVIAVTDAIRFGGNNTQDVVYGTFGTNTNQFSFFIAFMLAWLLGQWLRGRVGLSQLLVGGVAAIEFVLGRFQTLWFMAIVAAIIMFVIAGGSVLHRGRAIVLAAAIAVLVVPSLAVAGSVDRFTFTGIFSQFFDYFDQLGKVQLARAVPAVLTDTPWSPLIGVGPGSFNSRAFRTIARIPNAEVGASTDVAGALLDPFYSSRLADRYILPYFWIGRVFLSGTNTDAPFTSYVSIPIESGLIGGGAIALIYGVVLAALIRSARRRTGETSVLAVWALTSLLMLLGIATVDNYLEVTRYTMLVWLAVGLWHLVAHDRHAVTGLASGNAALLDGQPHALNGHAAPAGSDSGSAGPDPEQAAEMLHIARTRDRRS